jgi:hypothetical protein
MSINRIVRAASALVTIVMLAACGHSQTIGPNGEPGDTAQTWDADKAPEATRGSGGLGIFGSDKKEAAGPAVGVNSYLWRASLDTLAFMPLSSADPFGGVILTDWYSPPETPSDRFKISVFILDRTLRADGVRVSVFRQQRTGGGDWADAAVDQRTATDLENAILTRAREMRSSATAQK